MVSCRALIKPYYPKALLLLVVAGALLLPGPTPLAQAQSDDGSSVTIQSTGAIITVDTTADDTANDGQCSLREAVTNAQNNTNASPECAPGGSGTVPDTIVFGSGVSGGTITLDADGFGRLPDIVDPKGLVIDGGRAGITISGGDATGVFRVTSSGDLTLSNLTVAHGSPSESGGFGGGGAVNEGALRVINSTFSQNVTGRRGGGIFSRGQLTVTDSTFSANSAGQEGGGIFGSIEGAGDVTNSTFSGNSADQGGAIRNLGALAVTNSTFSGNNASIGGGISNGGVSNTVNGNTIAAELFLTNDTFSGNSASFNNGGGGLALFNLGTANLRNSIVANSPAGGNCSGTPTDDGYNISSDASCAFSQPTSRNSTNPLLDPNGLRNNGGPTKTIALLRGSPAVDAIPQGASRCGTTAATPLATDQRGVQRPQLAACDTGAFERQAPPQAPPPKKKHKKKHKRHH